MCLCVTIYINKINYEAHRDENGKYWSKKFDKNNYIWMRTSCLGVVLYIRRLQLKLHHGGLITGVIGIIIKDSKEEFLQNMIERMNLGSLCGKTMAWFLETKKSVRIDKKGFVFYK